MNDLEGQVEWSGITQAKVLSTTMILNHMGEMQMDIEIEDIKKLRNCIVLLESSRICHHSGFWQVLGR